MGVPGDTNVVGADLASVSAPIWVVDSILTGFTGTSGNDQTVVENLSFAETKPPPVHVHALLEHNWGRISTMQALSLVSNIL